MTTWALVADSRHAKIFSINQRPFELNEIADFVNPKEALHGDNPQGHICAAQGGTRHGLEPSTLPDEKETRAFAAELAKHLQREFLQQHFSKLILVAAPEFLGEVRGAMSEMLKASVGTSIAKDLLAYSNADLANYLHAQPGLH